MNKLFLYSTIFPVVFISFVSIFFIPAVVGFYKAQGAEVNFTFFKNSLDTFQSTIKTDINTKFIWPTPGYNNITSGFGYRNAPAGGASTYHGAIDIGAAEGSNILAIADGVVTYAGWNGANGYTVIIDYENSIVSTYGHVNPNFLVSKGSIVKQGDVVAKVGPKYVSKTNYTSYTDSSGKCTNGATTGAHLHFAISKNGKRIDPRELY